MKVSGTVTLACMVTVRVLYAVCATVVFRVRLVVFQYPVGKLALQSGDDVDQLVRLVALLIGIEPGAVDEFLEHEVATPILDEVGGQKDLSKGGDVAV